MGSRPSSATSSRPWPIRTSTRPRTPSIIVSFDKVGPGPGDREPPSDTPDLPGVAPVLREPPAVSAQQASRAGGKEPHGAVDGWAAPALAGATGVRASRGTETPGRGGSTRGNPLEGGTEKAP